MTTSATLLCLAACAREIATAPAIEQRAAIRAACAAQESRATSPCTRDSRQLPLFVIDGRALGRLDRWSDSVLDPDTIASVEVLKGEAAIARFGDEGRDGVVLITTKQKRRS